MSRKSKAYLIIGTYAAAAVVWSGATANIPVAGPLLADTSGLTLISILMAYSLAALYKIDLDTASLTAFATCVLGAIFGNVGLKMLASLVPIFGTFVNAAITGTLHTAIGLGICKLFEEGRDLNSVSSREFRRIVKECEEEAKTAKEKYDAAFSRLSREDQERVRKLQKRMKDKHMTDSDRDYIQNELGSIFGFSL